MPITTKSSTGTFVLARNGFGVTLFMLATCFFGLFSHFLHLLVEAAVVHFHSLLAINSF
jgi:hypothetical protein